MTSSTPPSLQPPSTSMAEHLQGFLLVAAALPPLFMLSLSRFDVVGFTFFVVAAAAAALSLWAKKGLLGMRVVPLLGLLAVIGYCGDKNRQAIDDALAAGPAIVAECRAAGACPRAPAGFTAEAEAPESQPESRVWVAERRIDGDRIALIYRVKKDDVSSFTLTARGPISSTRWLGGVQTDFRSAETVAPPTKLEQAISPPAPPPPNP